MPNSWYVVKAACSGESDVRYVAIELSEDLKKVLLKILLGKKALVKALGHPAGDLSGLSIRVPCYKAWWLKELPTEWDQMAVDYTLDDWELVRETPIVALAHSQDSLPDDFHSNILAPLESEDNLNPGINCTGDEDDDIWLYFDLPVEANGGPETGVHAIETPPLSTEIVQWLTTSIKKDKEKLL